MLVIVMFGVCSNGCYYELVCTAFVIVCVWLYTYDCIEYACTGIVEGSTRLSSFVYEIDDLVVALVKSLCLSIVSDISG